MLDEFFLCCERHGPKWRHVIEVEPSLAVEQYLRSKLPDTSKSPIKDVTHIYSYGSRLFLVDDVGMMLKGTTDYEGMPDVHVGFWDLALRGREDMCRKMALKIAEEGDTRGVWTAIPLESRATLAFAKRAGFVEQSRHHSIAVLTLLIT